MDKWTKLRRKLDAIDTPTQQWLKNESACLSGRRAVGERSLTQFWVGARSTSELGYLLWFVHRLGRITYDGSSNTVYSAAIDSVEEKAQSKPKGAKRAKFIKAGYARVMSAYGVQMPAGLL